jgi:hypothetical protein
VEIQESLLMEPEGYFPSLMDDWLYLDAKKDLIRKEQTREPAMQPTPTIPSGKDRNLNALINLRLRLNWHCSFGNLLWTAT